MLSVIRQFSSCSIQQAAMPALVKRLTRRATLRHLLNIKAQKEKHGNKFAFLEKHKRYPGLPGFVPRPVMPPLDLGPKTSSDMQFAITKEEIDYILTKLPQSLDDDECLSDQLEAIKRITSMDTASAAQTKQHEIHRVISLLQRSATDIGSPEIQVGVYTVRINRMTEHLKTHNKDSDVKKALQKWTGKRMKMLGAMKKKDLEGCVRVCKIVGVDPQMVINGQ